MNVTRFCAISSLVLAVSTAHAAPLSASRPLHLPASTLSQIAALEHEADARTPAQLKIDSQLVYSLKMARGEQVAPGVQSLRSSAMTNAAGMTLVDIDADVTPDLLYAVSRAGGTVVYTSERWKAVRANVPLSALETLALIPGVRFIKRAVRFYPQNPAPSIHSRHTDFLAPFVLPVPERIIQKTASVRLNLPGLLARVRAVVPGPQTSAVGSVVDEADKTHQADKARSTFHVDGTGIKVGVLSDSIDNFKDGGGAYAAALQSGDISPVSIVSGQQGDNNGEGEGLAMAEAVHHLAPGAKLYFATGASSEAQFADNIIALQKAGCKVILDDEYSPDESPFQDGIVAQAINTVTAAGAMYFSCAANYGNVTNQTASAWEGDYKDSGDASFGDGDLHTFDSSQGVAGEANNIQVASGDGSTSVELFWSDPLGKSSNDYDLVIVDSDYNVVAASTNRQTGSQDPHETVNAASGEQAVIIKHSGSTRYLHLNLDTQFSTFHFVTNQRVSGHNATANAFCVAATPAADGQGDGEPSGPYPSPFNSSNVVETFSDDGLRRVFYDPSGKAYTSSLTHTGGKVLNKPDFTAADGTSSTLPQGGGLNPFFGTSCATPHAGAIAALVLSYNPTLTRAQLSTILDNSATDIEYSGYDRDAGYGILNAYKALQNTPSSVTLSSVSLSPTTVTGGTENSTGTVTLSANAPSGGVVVTLSSSSSAISFSSTSITVPSGSKTATFRAYSHTVTSTVTVTVTAKLNGVSKTATIKVTPAVAATTLSALSFSPTTVTGGTQNTTGTVTLSGVAPSGGAVVSLSSSSSAISFPASTVTVAAGAASATFRAYSHSVTSTVTVTVTAKYGGASKTATIKVTPAGAAVTLTGLSFNPTSISSNGFTTGTVTLSAAAPSGGTAVDISSGGSSILTVAVPAGKTSTTFGLSAPVVSSTTTFSIVATLGSVTKSATLTVNPTTVTLTKLALSPSTVTSGSSTTGTVTLSANAPTGGAVVDVAQGSTELGTVIVSAGHTTVTFTYTPTSVSTQTKYTLTATYNNSTKTAHLTVNP